ncbi:MAG TPA: putative Ig domain-containing protein, partial [Opitutaceae bacterium]|nr:putative Ig domain-containing protein [Opitutaceae bacterium]
MKLSPSTEGGTSAAHRAAFLSRGFLLIGNIARVLAGLTRMKFSRVLLMALGLTAVTAEARAATVATPTFSPAAGTFTNVQAVTISTTTSGASIRYTLDGSTPSSTAGTVYSGPVTIVATKTLKAIGYESGFTSSSVTSGTYTINPTTLQAESLSPVGTGATVSTTTDANASGGKIEFLNATAASQTMTLTTPSVAAGTYQVQFHYQTATTRGQHTVKIDGTQIGSTIDQFASTSAYTTATLGNITFGTTGTHSILLAVTGKNSSSTKFTVTADSFILTPTLPIPVISSALSATGQVSAAFSYQITASNSPTSFNATGLPAGLSVSTTTGLISGTPTAAGTSNITISATNVGGTGSATLVLTVSPAKPVITSAATATGQVGVAFSYQITASNSPTSFAASPLPAGLSVSTTTGLISGTPTATGTTNVSLTATNAGGTSSAVTLVITITLSKPVITSAATATGQVGVAFSYQITASNSPTSFSATGLPAGLSVSTSTGLISGTPTTAATSSVTINATNATGTGTATLTLTVNPAKPAITSALTASGQTGVAFSYQITASNSPTSFAASPLPAGLSVSTTTGLISGTPTATGTTNVSLTATNAGGTSSAVTLAITITLGKPVITSATMATGQVGVAFSYQITASNSPTSFSATGLPAGLSVSTSTGLISGTPTTAATSSVTINATNATGTGTKTLILTVNPAKPAITSAATATGQVGIAFSYQITASNSPTSFAASPLPAGLSVSTSTGLISGTPTTAGTPSVTISATNAGGTGSKTLSLTITAAAAAPVFSLAAGVYTSPQNVTITSTTSGASIRYTTDNSTPTETNGTLYSGAVSISSTTTLKAIAYKSGFTDSGVTSGIYTINAPISLSGLCLWLNADAGVTTDSNGLVTTWSDQSGSANDATPDDPSYEPTLVTSASDLPNGQRVVHFDGNHRYLRLPNVMQDPQNPGQQFGQGEIFAVVRSTGVPGSLWGWGGANNVGSWYPNSDGTVWDDFGSTTIFDTGTPAQDLTQYHVYNISSSSTEWTQRFNGRTNYDQLGNAVAFITSPTIGTGSGAAFLTGDVAEVIVYNRVLSAAERDSTYQYLSAKYAPSAIVIPGTPVLQATAVFPTQADFSWSAANTASQHTVTTIERQTGSGGFVQIAQLNDVFSYTDTGLVAGQTYTYRVKLASYAGTSPYSNTVAITPPATGLPTAGLRLWLRSTAGVITDGNGLVNTWANQSVPGNDATQFASANQPQVVANQVNGLPVVRFSGNQMFNLPDLMSGASAGEIIAVVKVVDKTLGGYDDTNNKLWNFNQNGTGYNKNQPSDTVYYQYNTFGLDNADIGSDVPVSLVSDYHIFDTSSSSALCAEYYNGTL